MYVVAAGLPAVFERKSQFERFVTPCNAHTISLSDKMQALKTFNEDEKEYMPPMLFQAGRQGKSA